jgi:ribosomal protein S3AE
MSPYLGLQIDKVRSMLRRRTCAAVATTVRVVRRDGRSVVVAKDYCRNRLNVETINSHISRVLGWF